MSGTQKSGMLGATFFSFQYFALWGWSGMEFTSFVMLFGEFAIVS